MSIDIDDIHDKQTIIVERQPLFHRIDYSPVNKRAFEWTSVWRCKHFAAWQLKEMQKLGFLVLIQDGTVREFGT